MENQTETSPKVFLIGSKCNNRESVLVADDKASSLICFGSLQEAKDIFKPAYELLLSPSFTPSHPPGNDEMIYHQEFMRLIALSPVILELERDRCKDDLMQWRDEGGRLFKPETGYFDSEYWHLRMKPGFLEKFAVLDIVKDIETTPFIGPNGNIVIRVNEVHDGSKGSWPSKPLTREDVDEILRQKGFK